MPSTYAIHAHRGLCIIRHAGHATLAEAQASLAAFSADREFDPAHNHLVDMGDLLSFEEDLVGLLDLQARVVSEITSKGPRILVVFYAPNEVARRLTRLVRNIWDGLDQVVMREAETEACALAILGQPERRITDLARVAG